MFPKFPFSSKRGGSVQARVATLAFSDGGRPPTRGPWVTIIASTVALVTYVSIGNEYLSIDPKDYMKDSKDYMKDSKDYMKDSKDKTPRE
jgi:hypothetical protein